MKGKHVFAVIRLLLIFAFAQMALAACIASNVSAGYATGAWDNFDYSKPVDQWISAARAWGGDATVLDLAVAQARDGYAALPFPYAGSGTVRGVSDTDLLEPYLSRLDAEGIGVILSIQPMNADITGLIGTILDRYGRHGCIRGINVDLEWKQTGSPQHASNQERDAWEDKIHSYDSGLKLFLTFFKDYAYFPADDGQIVVMYDGTQDTQENLLKAYGELAKHFANVGIYTGYATSHPAAASNEAILRAAPNTQYIIHTDDAVPAGRGIAFDKISPGSALSQKFGFDMPGFSSKMALPSLSSGSAASTSFPATGGFTSAFRNEDSGSGSLFKFADAAGTGTKPVSQPDAGAMVEKTFSGSSQGMASPFSDGPSRGFGSISFASFGKGFF